MVTKGLVVVHALAHSAMQALPLPLAVNPRGAATRTAAARLGALLNSPPPPPDASQLAAQLAPPQRAHRWQRHHHLPKLRVAQREPRLQQRRERRRYVRLEAEAEHMFS